MLPCARMLQTLAIKRPCAKVRYLQGGWGVEKVSYALAWLKPVWYFSSWCVCVSVIILSCRMRATKVYNVRGRTPSSLSLSPPTSSYGALSVHMHPTLVVPADSRAAFVARGSAWALPLAPLPYRLVYLLRLRGPHHAPREKVVP